MNNKEQAHFWKSDHIPQVVSLLQFKERKEGFQLHHLFLIQKSMKAIQNNELL